MDEVIEEFNRVARQLLDCRRTRRTRIIKSILCRIGKARRFYICAKGVGLEGEVKGQLREFRADQVGEPEYHGWLYDLCWLEPETENGHWTGIQAVKLVLESEWSRSEYNITNDFEKLMVARSDDRVMVFQADDRSQVERLLEVLRKRVSTFTQGHPGDRYLVAGYDRSQREFVFDRYP